ncbi:MAG: acetyl esterase [Pirellulaceae bacterium]|jgi:acetyl esterase
MHAFRNTIIVSCLFVLGIGQSHAQQQKGYPPRLDGSEARVYKKTPQGELQLYIYRPAKGVEPTNSAIVFFFGGGWKSGTPKQFEQHCKYLASRGMVAITADYRVLTRRQTKAKECVADAKSAIRWVRIHAKELGVDPDRVVAGGGSAGGHIAACTGVIDGFDDANDDLKISAKPNAMALFNPAVALAPVEGKLPLRKEVGPTLPERMGVNPIELSPVHHISKGVPPTVIFHGKGDTTVLFESVEWFDGRMKSAGNICVLHGYADQPHGFFNHGRSENIYYDKTIAALDSFLVEHGFLNKRNQK